MELSSSLTWGVSTRTPAGAAGLSRLPTGRRSTQPPFRLPNPSGLRRTKMATSSREQYLLVTRCTQSTRPSAGAGEDDSPTSETTPELYTEIKNIDVGQASDLVVEEAKKLALELFSALSGLVGNNVEFVIKPTREDGTDVGVTCRLDWKKNLPLWKGSGLHTAHTYSGRMSISNVEAVFEPIIHNEALRLVFMGCLEPLLNQTAAGKVLLGEGKTRLMWSLVLLVATAVCFMFTKRLPHNK